MTVAVMMLMIDTREKETTDLDRLELWRRHVRMERRGGGGVCARVMFASL
jgi:hypothetical protein